MLYLTLKHQSINQSTIVVNKKTINNSLSFTALENVQSELFEVKSKYDEATSAK